MEIALEGHRDHEPKVNLRKSGKALVTARQGISFANMVKKREKPYTIEPHSALKLYLLSKRERIFINEERKIKKEIFRGKIVNKIKSRDKRN